MELINAVRCGDIVKLKSILDNPKNDRESINTLINGGTALHLALGTHQPIITTILLDNGADVNQYDSFGYAPIHIAILCAEQLARKRRRSKAMEMISGQEKKKEGYSAAQPKVKKLGSTDFDLNSASSVSEAISKKQEMSKKESMMEEQTSAMETRLREKEEGGLLEMADFGLLTLVLSAGADVDRCRKIIATGEVVASPLFEAVVQGEAELVRCLLEYGANPNQPGRSRDRSYAEPPLHVAARRECKQQVEICKLLLKFGAEPSAVAGGLGDDGIVHELFDATEECSTAWIKSLIKGMQMARRNEVREKLAYKKGRALAKAKLLGKLST